MRSEKEIPRWELSQSLLHIDDREKLVAENAYGKLRYAKEGERRGFIVEAKEAPGTPVHTEHEKHLDMKKMKKVGMENARARYEVNLYAAGLPFENQAFFYDISDKDRSREFVKCTRHMMKKRGHRTMEDAFGFLDVRTDRQEKELLEKERAKDLTTEEFRDINSRIDTLNDRICKKESKREQLQKTLRIMADKRQEEEKREQGKSEDRKRIQVAEMKLDQSPGGTDGDDEEQEQQKHVKKP